MFGIGLPELIVILALALIVVGPEKLPELARSLAKGVMELKKTANSLRDSIQEEMGETGKAAKPWEQLPQDRPPWSGESPETAAQESRTGVEADLEEQQETVILPEAEEREKPGHEDGEKAAS
jgi:Tat protein translocase TatB subunit